MGQNNSAQLATNSPRDPPPPKSPVPPRPPTPPLIPKIPNYAIPENRVLPIGPTELPDKRQLLRPVSQELSKFHPEFAQIFQYQDDLSESERPCQDPGSPLPEEEGGLLSGGKGLRRGEVGGKENEGIGTTTTTLIRATSGPVGGGRGGSDGDKGVLSSSRFSSKPHPLANNTIGTGRAGDSDRKPNNTELSRSQSVQESRLTNGSQQQQQPSRANGHVIMNGHVSRDPGGSDVTEGGVGRARGPVMRTHSLDRSTSGPLKAPRGHKRYPSASIAAAAAQQPQVIPEDPREHLYSHWRQDPFSNPLPSTTSLPLESSFGLDYKMNLTYAQLAEHRRQKRVAALEGKEAGKMLADLNADLKEQSTVKVSPFDRKNYIPVLSQPCGSSTTGSSDTGVSKSKKRRAPPPPGGAPPAPRDNSPGRFSLDVEPPADYDMDDPSPPLEAPSPWTSRLSRHNSNVSMGSRNSNKGPAPKVPAPAPVPPPPPPPSAATGFKSASAANGPQSAIAAAAAAAAKTPSNPMSAQSARLIAQAKAEIEALKKLEMILKEKGTPTAEGNETAGEEKTGNGQRTDNDGNEGGVDDAKEKSDSDRSKEAGGVDVDVVMKDTESSGNEASERKEEPKPTAATDDTSKPPPPPQEDSTNKKSESSGSGSNSPRRLSSLLQHDIALAAQARSAKGQVKAKTPMQHVKPKDPAELFREELAKAATAREERVKSVELQEKDRRTDDLLNGVEPSGDRASLVFQSDMVKIKRKPAISEIFEISTAVRKASPPPVFPKPESPRRETQHTEVKASISRSESDLLSTHNGDTRKVSGGGAATLGRQRPPEGYLDRSSGPVRKAVSHNGILELSDDDDVGVSVQTAQSSASLRQFTDDWKPEDDLDTDDDMMDDLTYSRSSAMLESSDGFKSSIIPSKVDDLKTAKRKSSKSGRRESSSSNDENKKFGSIRKFQKSVHKSVRNAFGSISKASGKLLRRNRSLDLGQEGEVEGMKYRVTTQDDPPPKAIVTNGTDQHFHMNGDVSEDETDDDDEENNDPSTRAAADKPVRVMKRAGVAYVGRKGQIVVLPEFENVQLDEDGNVIHDHDDGDGRAPKIVRKKQKKFTYESTVREKERDLLERRYTEEIQEKEREIEAERRKQKDMEREFQRLRDMETQEKLQRLQTAQLQQQMNLLQQQQQQQHLGTMQFAATPASYHPHQRYTMPDFPAQHGGLYTTAAGLGGVGVSAALPPVNMGSYSLQTSVGPFFTGPASTSAAATATTIGGYDVNYLSNYMRMMGIQPPSTQQQWAYLLSSIQGLTPAHSLVSTSAKTPVGVMVGSAGPDLSHLFPSKAGGPIYTDTSALLAQKATLMNILNSAQHVSQSLPSDGSLATTGALTVTTTNPGSVEVVGTSEKDHPASYTQPQEKNKKKKKLKKTASADKDSDLPLQERANPLYLTSEDDDDEEEEEEEEEEVQPRKNSKKKTSRSSGKAKSQPLSSSSARLPHPHPGGSVYRDVTSRDEMGVTRVKVPDYYSGGSNPRDRAVDRSVEDSDDSEEEKGYSARMVVMENGVKRTAKGEEEEEDEEDEEFQTVQFQHRQPLSRVASAAASFPAKVYAPLGYRHVAFNPSQQAPRAAVQTGRSVHR